MRRAHGPPYSARLRPARRPSPEEPSLSLAERIAAPLLGLVPPERAHELGLRALESGLVPRGAAPPAALRTSFAGIDLPSPLGMAAGFDKDARVPDALGRLRFGHVEIGTVTPLPQPGNPRPRVFRLPCDRALVNRLGFPSEGLDAVARRLRDRRRSVALGANVGCNASSDDPVGDICAGILRLGPLADYVCVNVSSPNTPGLRDLQTGPALDALLRRADEARRRAEDEREGPLPLVVKIAPDLEGPEVEDVAGRISGSPVEGLSVSNTTVQRPDGLRGEHRDEAGGLSGRPLMEPSTRLLARLHGLLPERVALIGIGGVSGAEDAWRKIEAGATLVQLYTALIWQGPLLVPRIHRGLRRRLAESGHASLLEARGCRAAEIAEGGP